MGRSLFDSRQRKWGFLFQSFEFGFGDHPASKGRGEVKQSACASNHPSRLILWLRISGAIHLFSLTPVLTESWEIHIFIVAMSPPLMKEWRRKDFDLLLRDYSFDSVEGTVQNVKWQDRDCTYGVTLRRLSLHIFAFENKNLLRIFILCL